MRFKSNFRPGNRNFSEKSTKFTRFYQIFETVFPSKLLFLPKINISLTSILWQPSWTVIPGQKADYLKVDYLSKLCAEVGKNSPKLENDTLPRNTNIPLHTKPPGFGYIDMLNVIRWLRHFVLYVNERFFQNCDYKLDILVVKQNWKEKSIYLNLFEKDNNADF